MYILLNEYTFESGYMMIYTRYIIKIVLYFLYVFVASLLA